MEDAVPYRSSHFYQLGADAQSALVKRSVVIKGHKTSISLEDIFWAALRHIALDQNTTISEIVARIDAKRNGSTRSSAIRQYIMADMQDRALGRVDGRLHRKADDVVDAQFDENTRIEETQIEETAIEKLAATPKLAPVD